MKVEPFELKEEISQMPDEELLQMVGTNARQYRWDALELAKTELARRGVAIPQSDIVRCTKCGGVMEEGFVPDFGHYQYVRTLKWVEGQPEHSVWSGTVIADRRTANILAYRCTTCGYLDFHAIVE